MSGDAATQMTPYVSAAVIAYGTGVLVNAQPDNTDAGLGRRLLQAVFGTLEAGVALPQPLADLAANPRDEDELAVVRLAIRKVLASNPTLEGNVRAMLAAARPPVAAPNQPPPQGTGTTTSRSALGRWFGSTPSGDQKVNIMLVWFLGLALLGLVGVVVTYSLVKTGKSGALTLPDGLTSLASLIAGGLLAALNPINNRSATTNSSSDTSKTPAQDAHTTPKA
jgi:hypothetical protein